MGKEIQFFKMLKFTRAQITSQELFPLLLRIILMIKNLLFSLLLKFSCFNDKKFVSNF